MPPPPGDEPIEFRQPVGEPTSVAIDGRGRVVVQTREPARLEILTHKGGTISLSTVSRADTGHQVFHLTTQSGLACASCHPEGGDDGRSWRFAKIGIRRTQNLRGGVLATAPFHWDGDMRDMRHLMTEVFMGRMTGPQLDTQQTDMLARWIDHLPAMPALPVASADAVDRGKALFNDGAVGCATCHSGTKLTNNQNMVVGTGRHPAGAVAARGGLARALHARWLRCFAARPLRGQVRRRSPRQHRPPGSRPAVGPGGVPGYAVTRAFGGFTARARTSRSPGSGSPRAGRRWRCCRPSTSCTSPHRR